MNSDFNSQINSIINQNTNMKPHNQPPQQQQPQQQQRESPFDQQEQKLFSEHQQHPQQQQQQQQSLINSLGSIPLPLLSQIPAATASLLQSQNPQLNQNILQQLLQQAQQQQAQQQQLQHHLLEEQLLKQAQQQQQLNQNQRNHQQQNYSPPSQQPQHQQQQHPHQHHHHHHHHQNQQTQVHQSNNINANTANNNSHRGDNTHRQQNQQFNDDLEKLSSQFSYLPGTASLIQYIDKQLMVILRDGKTLIGYLRSIDQYANLLLSNAIERIHVGNKYGDISRGIYMIRGENVVLLGEVDFTIPLKISMEQVSEKEILELQSIEKKKQEEAEKAKKKALLEHCLIPNTDTMLDEYY